MIGHVTCMSSVFWRISKRTRSRCMYSKSRGFGGHSTSDTPSWPSLTSIRLIHALSSNVSDRVPRPPSGFNSESSNVSSVCLPQRATTRATLRPFVVQHTEVSQVPHGIRGLRRIQDNQGSRRRGAVEEGSGGSGRAGVRGKRLGFMVGGAVKRKLKHCTLNSFV